MRKGLLLAALMMFLHLCAPDRVWSLDIGAPSRQWTPPVNLFETEGRASEAEVVTDLSGVVHVFWAFGAPGAEENGSAQAIYYSRYKDGVWSEPVDVLISPGGRVARMHAVVSDAQGYLHIVWSGGDSIFYSQAHAAKAGDSRAWTAPRALITGATSLAPAIAISQQNELYVLWSQGGSGLMFVRSIDSGQSWSEPRAIYEAGGPKELAASGRIAVDERGRLHIVFTYAVEDADPGNSDIHVRNPMYLYYMRSDDNGETWTEPWLVVPEPRFGEIAVATYGEDMVHLVWNGRAGRDGRYHRWSPDGGRTWSDVIEVLAPAPLNPIGTGGLTGFPALVTDAIGSLHLVSATGRGQYYFRWQAGVWSPPLLISPGVLGGGVTNTAESIEQPSIALSEGNRLHVVFHDGFERIWYTGATIDAPYLPPQPLPPPRTEAIAMPTAQPIAPTAIVPTSTPMLPVATQAPPGAGSSTYLPLLVSVLPVVVLIGIVVVAHNARRRR